jgi:SHAQKYF class myb-like DNA-binding protein
MREEEEASWFARGEEQQLLRPDELMPLTQTLITLHLVVAFDITTHGAGGTGAAGGAGAGPGAGGPDINGGGASSAAGSSGGGGGGAGDESAQTLKRPRLVWTPQLHKRFVDVVAHLGIKNAMPKTIMQLMSVDGLTRENVASHPTSRSTASTSSACRGWVAAAVGARREATPLAPALTAPPSTSSPQGPSPSSRRATARLPPPAATRPSTPMGDAHHHHQHHQIGHFHHPATRLLGHYGGAAVAGFDHDFLSRVGPPAGPPGMHHRMVGGGARMGMMAPASFTDEMDLGSRGGGGSGGRRELTLFPTSGDH